MSPTCSCSPSSTDNVIFAIRKAAHAGRRLSVGAAAAVSHGRIVTVFSPKGGTGKTAIATNLASALAKHEGKRTLLLDLDLQFGDAAIMLGLQPEKTIYDFVSAPGELDPEKLAGYTTRHVSGLDILPAPLRPEDAELVTEAKIGRLLEVARTSYDVIVVDTSPFFHGPMLATLDQTDELLLVCSLDVPTIKNVRLSLQTLELLSFPMKKVHVVLNRANTKVGMKESEVETALERKVRYQIPSDRAVPLSVNRGAPRRARGRRCGLLDRAPQCREGRCQSRAGAEREASPALCKGIGMGLHDRINKTNGTATLDPLAAGQPAHETSAEPRNGGDPYAELKTRIHHECIAKLGAELFRQTSTEDMTERVLRAVSEQLALDRTPLTREERRRIVREITDDILGYGPLDPLLRDDSVTEVMVNACDQVYVERDGKIERSTASFADNAHLLRIIDKIVSQVGRRIDEASPMVDARLPDGSRVNAIIPPLALKGPTLTIRKFSRDPYTVNDLISFGTISAQAAQFLAACVKGKLNVLISGGTGTGKTTTLNALSAFVPADERIVTIEDAAELQLQQEHVITLESRPPNIEGQGEVRIRELVRNALRMRPDRIIVGEVRGPETLDMLQAMNTGHEGSLTTIHANSPRDALSRLETLVMTGGIELPHRAIREQIASAFDLLVQIQRLVDGSRRITHIAEVVGMESEVVTLQDIFLAKPPDEDTHTTGRASRLLSPLAATGLKPHFIEKLAANGVVLPLNFFGRVEDGGEASYAGAAYGGFR